MNEVTNFIGEFARIVSEIPKENQGNGVLTRAVKQAYEITKKDEERQKIIFGLAISLCNCEPQMDILKFSGLLFLFQHIVKTCVEGADDNIDEYINSIAKTGATKHLIPLGVFAAAIRTGKVKENEQPKKEDLSDIHKEDEVILASIITVLLKSVSHGEDTTEKITFREEENSVG